MGGLFDQCAKQICAMLRSKLHCKSRKHPKRKGYWPKEKEKEMWASWQH